MVAWKSSQSLRPGVLQLFKDQREGQGGVVHPGTREGEEGGTQVQGQLGHLNKILSQNLKMLEHHSSSVPSPDQ